MFLSDFSRQENLGCNMFKGLGKLGDDKVMTELCTIFARILMP